MSVDNNKVTQLSSSTCKTVRDPCMHVRSCRPCGRTERERADYRAALIELAIKICTQSGHGDPFTVMPNRKPRWFRYVPGQAKRHFHFTVMT